AAGGSVRGSLLPRLVRHLPAEARLQPGALPRGEAAHHRGALRPRDAAADRRRARSRAPAPAGERPLLRSGRADPERGRAPLRGRHVMRIRRLRVEGFGNLKGDFIFSSDRCNLILEPNESGKSTLAAAILAALYGFPKERASR